MLGPFIVVRYGLSMLGIQGGSLIGVLFNLAKGGFGLLGSAIVSVGKLLLGNPIVLAVAAIAGAAYLIYQYWTPIKAFFSDLWAQVTAAFDSALAWLGQLLAALNPIPILSAAWSGLTAFFSDIWESVKVAFDGGLAGIGALLVNWSPLGLLYQAITGALGTLGVELPGNFTHSARC